MRIRSLKNRQVDLDGQEVGVVVVNGEVELLEVEVEEEAGQEVPE